MLEDSAVAECLIDAFERKPKRAERFGISSSFQVDFLEFADTPYQGVNSIITNGVSQYYDLNKLEFIMTYSPNSVNNQTDLNALVATYLQLYYLDNFETIGVGEYFKVSGKLIREYSYVGIYMTRPCYFEENVFNKMSDIGFLWLIPIYMNEFEFIEKNSSEAFEEYLELRDPDLTLLDRKPLMFE